MILCTNNHCVIANACLRNQKWLEFREEGDPRLLDNTTNFFTSTDEGECNHYIERIQEDSGWLHDTNTQEADLPPQNMDS